MPQASDAQRAEWDGPSEDKAIAHLKAAGYRLNSDWTWTPPPGHTLTEKDLSAIRFMVDEWDYGGIEPGDCDRSNFEDRHARTG